MSLSIADLGQARRADWDYSDRTFPMVNAMLGQLARERDPIQRQGIVDRLTHYLRDRRPEEIDFQKINAAFAQGGFGPLPFTPAETRRRPRSEMPPGLELAFRRFEQLGDHADGRDPRLVAQLCAYVRQKCGEAVTQEEFDEAVLALRQLPRSFK